VTAAEIYASLDRRLEDEGQSASEMAWEAWLDEQDRQLELAGECARDEYEARELERAE
jgi:hypothetical protein